MSKAEDKAKEFLKKLVSHTTLYKGTIDELEVYEPYDVIWAYKEGYHQAEKDLELTWEDIPKIFQISEELKTSWWFRDNEQTKQIGTQVFWEEVLKRFNKEGGNT